MENTKFILYYSSNESDNFTCFLPLDLENESDKNLYDHLESSDNNKQNIKLPINKDNYKYLIELKVENFETVTVSSFFKQYRLEEWIL